MPLYLTTSTQQSVDISKTYWCLSNNIDSDQTPRSAGSTLFAWVCMSAVHIPESGKKKHACFASFLKDFQTLNILKSGGTVYSQI